MNILLKSTYVVVLLLVCFVPCFAAEIIHYSNTPIIVELQDGQERSIQFGDHVEVGITKAQQLKKLFRVQSAQGAIHILPYTAFEKQRIQIKRVSDGRIILLDLVATKAPENAFPLENIRILLESENGIPEAIKQEEGESSEVPDVTPVDLTRYAAQHMYGPARLNRDRNGIKETTLGVAGLVNIFKGPNKLATSARAVAAYQGGGYYLAAMHVKNTSSAPVQLSYLDLNIPFSHATFQHHVLSRQGQPGDSTMLYLISERPLKETLYPWTYYQDMKEEQERVESEEERRKAEEEHQLFLHTYK